MQHTALRPGQVADLSTDLVSTYFSTQLAAGDGKGEAVFPRLIRFGTHGDGTCFFHSVCAALNFNGYLTKSLAERKRIGSQFRCKFMDHVTSDRWRRFLRKSGADESYEKWDFRTAKQAFCTTATWADEQMIKWCSTVLRKNIIFIDARTNHIYCGVRGLDREDTIVVLWINGSHFEPVGVVYDHDPRAEKVQIQMRFHPDRDADVVAAIMGQYEAQCEAGRA